MRSKLNRGGGEPIRYRNANLPRPGSAGRNTQCQHTTLLETLPLLRQCGPDRHTAEGLLRARLVLLRAGCGTIANVQRQRYPKIYSKIEIKSQNQIALNNATNKQTVLGE